VRRRKVEPVDVSMSDLKGLIKGSVLVVIASVMKTLTTRDLVRKQHCLFWGHYGEATTVKVITAQLPSYYAASPKIISKTRRRRTTYNTNNRFTI
jgi:hypothetical protein